MYSTIRRAFYCNDDREQSLPKLRAAMRGIRDYLAARHADVTLVSVDVGEDDIDIGYETNELDDE